jgi:hypothetical protein
MKKDYMINISYYEDEKRNESVDELAKIIVKNSSMFEFIDFWKHKDNEWYSLVIQLSEINKNINLFNDDNLVLTLIEKLNNDIDESIACIGCNSITINNSPYHYRDYGGCIGKSFECPYCSELDNKALHEVIKIRKSKGEKEAIEHVLKILKQEYKGENIENKKIKIEQICEKMWNEKNQKTHGSWKEQSDGTKLKCYKKVLRNYKKNLPEEERKKMKIMKALADLYELAFNAESKEDKERIEKAIKLIAEGSSLTERFNKYLEKTKKLR